MLNYQRVNHIEPPCLLVNIQLITTHLFANMSHLTGQQSACQRRQGTLEHLQTNVQIFRWLGGLRIWGKTLENQHVILKYFKKLWETMETSPCYCKTRKHMKNHHCIANITIFLHGTYRKIICWMGTGWWCAKNVGYQQRQTYWPNKSTWGVVFLSCTYCLSDVFGRIRTVANFF